MSEYKSSQKEKFIAHVDPDLEDLIPGYLENRTKDTEERLNALEANDFASIQRSAHSMKGSGGGYGFDRITEIGSALEEAAKRQDPEAIRERVGDLSDYLDRVEIIVDSD